MKLASGIHLADFGDRAVLLNVRANQYHMVSARHAETLANVTAGRAGDDEDAEMSLLRAGFIDRSNTSQLAARHDEPPRDSALEMDRADGAGVTMGGVAMATLEAVVRLKWTPFSAVILWAGALKSRCAVSVGQSGEALVGSAQAFDRLRMRVPLRRICLRDALALFALLSRDGHATSLVFGVRLDPFEAHCWVQIGKTVLSDRLDNVRQMSPILTI